MMPTPRLEVGTEIATRNQKRKRAQVAFQYGPRASRRTTAAKQLVTGMPKPSEDRRPHPVIPMTEGYRPKWRSNVSRLLGGPLTLPAMVGRGHVSYVVPHPA